MSPTATSVMPTAAANSTGMSASGTLGIDGSGKPCGSAPITSTPRAARSRAVDATSDTTTATRMPGVRGDTTRRPRMIARLMTPIASAQ